MTTYTKADVKEFWNRNVCQVEFIKDKEPGTQEFFEQSEHVRYKYHFYLPLLFDWMKQHSRDTALLEIGCGMGTDLLQLAKRGFDVTGIDLTEEGISLARKRFQMHNIPARLKIGDAENLDFDNDTFDVVYSFGVLHHTPDTQKAIDEVNRVLKPGGLAVIMLYHRRSFNYIVHRILNAPFDGNRRDRCPIERTYTRGEIKGLFQGYSKVQIELEYFMTTGYGILWDIFPRFLHRLLCRYWGWHIVIKAIK
jgi:ubiquinone/menaquinone biosynthesis C-methylase UbiE